MAVAPTSIGIPASGSKTVDPNSAEVDAILATIRQQESGGNYTIVTSGGSDACGAYQYISSTWQAEFDRALAAGYLPVGTAKTARACQAPPAVQDAVARYDVVSFLNSVGGQVSLVPLHWYYPAAVSDPSLLGYTPPGNRISIGAYQANWMKTYAKISGDPSAWTPTQAQLTSAGGVLGTGLSPLNLLSPITNLFSGPVSTTWVGDLGRAILQPIFNEAIYFGEIVGGFALIVLGVVIILVDTGTLSKMPMPVPIPV